VVFVPRIFVGALLSPSSFVIRTMIAPLAFVLGAAIATAVSYAKRRAPVLNVRTSGEAIKVLEPEPESAFDTHLPPSFEDAVVCALQTEKDTARLQDFAETLVPDYPIAASYLLARKANLAPNAVGITLRSTPAPPPARLSPFCDPADAAQTVLCAIVLQPALVRLLPTVLARRLYVPELVAQAVLASVRPAGSGFVIDAPALRRFVGTPTPPPPVGANDAKLALLALRGKPSAKRALDHQIMQNPAASGSVERAKRTARQAMRVASYTDKKAECL
jgi:hypothetical protein